MKPWKKTRNAWIWTMDDNPRGQTKKMVTRIERRKIKDDAQKELNQYQDDQLADWEDMRDSFRFGVDNE